MKLKEIEIIEFKSIIRERIVMNSNQLCLVGKNESGKSSIIQAISYLDILEKDFVTGLINKNSVNYPDGMPIVAGVFKLSKEEYSKLFEKLSEFIPGSNHSKLPSESDNSLMQVKRWGNGISNISIDITDCISYGLNISQNVKEKANFHTFLHDNFYPKIEYFEKEELLIEPANVKELLSNDKKFETFRRLLRIAGCDNFNRLKTNDVSFLSTLISKFEANLNLIFEKHYKQDKSINIKLQSVFGDKLCLIIQDDTGGSFTIDERSPGFQYYFSFLVNKLYTKSINKNRNTIFLLDEPGNNLHPQGSKDLLKSFDEISKDSQIIFTTHNPFLTIRNCIDSLVFVNKDSNKGTKINQKTFLNKYQILRKELGIILNDSFLLGDINLVVEGNTEKLAFHRLFSLKKYQKLEWINIYNADGVSQIPQAVNYLGFNNLNLSGIVILDSDKEANDIRAIKHYKKNISRDNWEEIEINSVFNDKKLRTFEDLFPPEIYLAAFNSYCHSLSNLEIFEKEYQDLPVNLKIDTPIIDIVTHHYKSFLYADKKNTITKQDVIRILLDDIEQLDDESQSIALKKIFELIDKILEAYWRIEKHVNH
jgi:predicted ATP-dependent endonuclease of OLD family